MNWESILRFKSIGVVLALALAVAIPVGYVAATGDHDDYHFGHFIIDPIKTDAGYVAGTMIGDIGSEVRIYRGIPYGAPPIGDLRWKPPQPVTPWKGIRECTKYSPMAPQPFPASPVYGSVPESGMSEDCLYLNVLTPARKENERLPVMVWFHGGGITTGSSNMTSYNREYLPLHGVVLVTVQQRIGPLGYMAHPELTAESPSQVSGNYGQLDLIAALKWVKKNITAFGGNPRNVTIFGHSGGGSKTLWLMASPLAEGLFQKAIVEAGCCISSPLDPMSMCKSLQDAESGGLNLEAKLGASNLADLRTKTWQQIIIEANKTGSGYSTDFTIDGWSLPDSIYNIFKAGQQNDVPFMIGAGEGEPLKILGVQLWADALLTGHSNMYAYIFTHVPANWREDGVKAYHGLEVAYQFNAIDNIKNHYGLLLRPTTGIRPDPGIGEVDEWLTEANMTIWAKFAATGNPSVKGLVWWPAFSLNPGKDKYLDIAYPLEVRSGYMELFH